jgi:hypothetical protein
MKNFGYLVAILLFITACGKDDPQKVTGLGKGLLVSNEGPFGTGTGTITFINYSGKVNQHLFQSANNGAVLGNVVQSVQFYRNRYYIVVNNANKIVIADNQFRYLGEINGLHQPRFIVFYGNYAFVSQWGEKNLHGGVSVVNLANNSLEKVIETGNGAEEMLLTNDSLWVTNGGSYNPDDFSSCPDSTVTLINADKQTVTTEFKVGDNPNSIAKAGKTYYIACAGKGFKNGSVYQGVPGEFQKMNVQGLDASLSSFSKMIINSNTNKDMILINGGSAISFNINGNTLDTYKVIVPSAYRAFYRTSNRHFYFCDPADFNSSGSVIETDEKFTKLNTYQAGIIPGYILEVNQ